MNMHRFKCILFGRASVACTYIFGKIVIGASIGLELGRRYATSVENVIISDEVSVEKCLTLLNQTQKNDANSRWLHAAVLKKLIKAGQVEKAAEVSKKMYALGMSNRDSSPYDEAMRGFFEIQRPDDAARMFELMKKTENHMLSDQAYRSMALQFVSTRRTDLFARLLETCHVDTHGHLYENFLASCAASGRAAEAEKVFFQILTQSAGSGIDDITPTMYEHLLKAYVNTRQIDKVERLMEVMAAQKVKFTDKIHCLILRGYMKSKDYEKTRQFMDLMSRRSVALTEDVFVTMLNEVARDGTVQDMKEVMSMMKEHHIGASGKHVSGLMLNALVRNKQLPAARQVLSLMQQNATSTVHSFTSVIKGYVAKKMMSQAWEVFQSMKASNIKPNLITYGTLMTGASTCSDATEQCENIYKMMREDGIKPDDFIESLMINTFANRKQLHRPIARDIQRRMHISRLLS